MFKWPLVWRSTYEAQERKATHFAKAWSAEEDKNINLEWQLLKANKESARLAKELDLLWKHANRNANKPQKRAKDGKWCK